MSDFLTFKSFISMEVLIVFYYMGAIMIPVAMWFFAHWLIQRFNILKQSYEKGKHLLWSSLTTKQKIILALFFTVCFFFMQLFWRMLFEFLIAYMQMRDALVLTL
ncbi:MAG TPA: DUF4282 domain-containing protein [Campylobacterales bacterium]|nr:DUF4282 domain-containing protein [Campylobacterales bacterium]